MAKPFLRIESFLSIGITLWQLFTVALANKANPLESSISPSSPARIGGRGVGDQESNDPAPSAIDTDDVDGSDGLTSNLSRDDLAAPALSFRMKHQCRCSDRELLGPPFAFLPSTPFIVCGNSPVSVLRQTGYKI